MVQKLEGTKKGVSIVSCVAVRIFKRHILLASLLLSISCQSEKSDQINSDEPVEAHAFAPQEQEEFVEYEAAIADDTSADLRELTEEMEHEEVELTADQILANAGHTWGDRFFYSYDKRKGQDEQPTSMLDDAPKITGYLLYHLGIDVVCDENVDTTLCASSLDNLILATDSGQIPSNPTIVPIGYIEIVNQTNHRGEEPYLNYVLGLNGKLFVSTGPVVSVDDWAVLIDEALSSSYRTKAVNDWIDGVSDEVLELEELFEARIIKGHGLDEDEFQTALQKLKQVSEMDEDLRKRGKFSAEGFDKDEGLGNKAFQRIVVRSQSRDTFQFGGKLAVEIDWESDVEDIYFHLLKQANVSPKNTYTSFQIHSFQQMKRFNRELSENYLSLLDKSLPALSLQQEISEAYLDIPRITGISSIRCDISMAMHIYACRDILLDIVNSTQNPPPSNIGQTGHGESLSECPFRYETCRFFKILEDTDTRGHLDLIISSPRRLPRAGIPRPEIYIEKP